MSATKDKVIDDMNARVSNGVWHTTRRYTREELKGFLKSAYATIDEQRREIETLQATGSDIMNGQSVLAKSLEDAQATIGAHEKTIADLEGKVKELGQWFSIAQLSMKIVDRMGGTVDNVAKMGAALVPNTVAPR